MRHYCAESLIYGEKTQPAHQQFPKVLVILNPVADKKSAVDTVCIKLNEKYVDFLMFFVVHFMFWV